MSKDAQELIALGLCLMFIALGVGGCAWMFGEGVKARSEGIVMKYDNGVGGK